MTSKVDDSSATKDAQRISTFENMKKVADRFGYVLNPDEKGLNRILTYMTENNARYGSYFCPCKQHYPIDRSADPVCPCPTFEEEIAQNGHCECHVFFDSVAAENVRRSEGLLSTVTCPG